MENNIVQNNKYTCEFTVDEWNVILGGLNELPYKHSANLITGIHTQIDSQMKAEPQQQ